jgi:hypothetical protein
MSDFSFLAAIKSHLRSNLQEQTFYLSSHADMTYPCCLLELDEIQHNRGLGTNSILSKIKFRTVCLGEEVGIKSNLDQANRIGQQLDGHQITLMDGRFAMIKLMGHRVEISKNDQKKTVCHFYEALIRQQ